jgi:hypothetical protein
LREELERLQRLLSKYESGQITHYDEDERGLLRHDTTAERRERMKARIAEIERKLREDATPRSSANRASADLCHTVVSHGTENGRSSKC